MNTKFIKTVTIAVCSCFVIPANNTAVSAAILSDANLPAPTDSLIPPHLGTVADASYNNGSKTLINIMDLHADKGVQENISEILSELSKKINIGKIYVEGSYGKTSVKWLSNIKNSEMKHKLRKFLLSSGRLTGAENYAVLSGNDDLLYGAEDKEVYFNALKTLENIYKEQGGINRQLQYAQYVFDMQSEKYYSAENKKLNEFLSKKSGTDSAQYYASLIKKAEKAGIDPDYYPQIVSFLKNNRKKPDAKRLSKQFSAFLGDLKETMPFSEYAKLANMAKDKTSEQELYALCYKIITENPSFGKKYARLKKFFYGKLNGNTNGIALIKEENRLIRLLHYRFSKTDDEKKIYFLKDYLEYLKGYLTNSLTAEGFEYISEYENNFKSLWKHYIDPQAIIDMERYCSLAKTFYGYNCERNRHFIDAIYGKMPDAPEKLIRIKSGADHKSKTLEKVLNSKSADILITGGFHSDGLAKILYDENINYISIVPNVSKADAEKAGETYKTIFNNRQKLLEQTIQNILLSIPDGDHYMFFYSIDIINFLKLENIDIKEMFDQILAYRNQEVRSMTEDGKNYYITIGSVSKDKTDVKNIVIGKESGRTDENDSGGTAIYENDIADFYKAFKHLTDVSLKAILRKEEIRSGSYQKLSDTTLFNVRFIRAIEKTREAIEAVRDPLLKEELTKKLEALIPADMSIDIQLITGGTAGDIIKKISYTALSGRKESVIIKELGKHPPEKALTARNRFLNEISIFRELMKSPIAPFFPRLEDSDAYEGNEHLALEFVSSPPLVKFLANNVVSDEILEKIFNKFMTVLKGIHKLEGLELYDMGNTDVDLLGRLIKSVTGNIDRAPVEGIAPGKHPIVLQDTLMINGVEYKGIKKAFESLGANKYFKRRFTASQETLVHGDFHFLNMFYDERTDRLKVIDFANPFLGGTGFSDPLLDVGRFSGLFTISRVYSEGKKIRFAQKDGRYYAEFESAPDMSLEKKLFKLYADGIIEYLKDNDMMSLTQDPYFIKRVFFYTAYHMINPAWTFVEGAKEEKEWKEQAFLYFYVYSTVMVNELLDYIDGRNVPGAMFIPMFENLKKDILDAYSDKVRQDVSIASIDNGYIDAFSKIIEQNIGSNEPFVPFFAAELNEQDLERLKNDPSYAKELKEAGADSIIMPYSEEIFKSPALSEIINRVHGEKMKAEISFDPANGAEFRKLSGSLSSILEYFKDAKIDGIRINLSKANITLHDVMSLKKIIDAYSLDRLLALELPEDFVSGNYTALYELNVRAITPFDRVKAVKDRRYRYEHDNIVKLSINKNVNSIVDIGRILNSNPKRIQIQAELLQIVSKEEDSLFFGALKTLRENMLSAFKSDDTMVSERAYPELMP
ncbi:MAG: hypothetical protein LBR69_06125, partial [Endomicrobium sp.]|nr:hypothetical protein [Endomicrobium sp.]